MTRTRYPLTLAATLVLGICGAPAASIKDSADFNLKLEMDTVPTPILGLSAGWSSTDGVLTVNNSINGGDGAFGWNGQLANASGYTMEIRYQVAQVNSPGTSVRKYTLQFYGADGSGTASLNVIQIGAPLESSLLGVYSQQGNLGVPITPGEWHTLRIAEEASSNQLLLWSDGVEIVGFDWQPGNNSTVNRAWTGDVGGNVTDGIYMVDYLRLDNSGAYAPTPVPEPASLALMVLGSLLILRRCRH